jgi:predicted SAM-dependent methyltransferase
LTKLNLACGRSKFKNCINLDVEASLKPDVVANLRENLPFGNESFDEIYLFHTIEHIEKIHHPWVLKEIHRILKSTGIFYISYPEFSEIVKRWLDNTHGKREFWEATVYGRQSHKSDYHVSAMDSTDFVQTMMTAGFVKILRLPEPGDTFNTIMTARKGVPFISTEELLYNDVFA